MVKCEKCGSEFTKDEALKYPSKVYVYKGKVICEDCLNEMGVPLDDADPYAIYYSH